MIGLTSTRHTIASLLPGLLATLSLVACGGGGGPTGGPPPAKVSVAEVVIKDVTEWDDFSGRVEAVDSVDVRPRVAGYLREVHFQEGAVVKKGDLLFSIDDREFQADLALANANVERAKTRIALAEQELARGEKLAAARALSNEELDQRSSEMALARAELKSAEAEQARARLNVEFTRLTAPIDGRVGEALVRPGNLVAPGETTMTTVVSIDPIHVVFEGDERIYLKYQAQAQAGERPSSREAPNPVQVGLASDRDFPFRGTMNFVDNQINPATGTIQGRAVLPNPDGFLIPGLFARVRLLGSGAHEAMLIHDAAILTDQDRKFVYIVDEQNLAQRRDIVPGGEVEGLRIVESGLAAGDRIVVNGVRKIFFPGAPVIPATVPMDAPMSEPAAAGS
ncbi:MAG: efflux RND transporter periplasmic adaptor subunit [Pseudomonadota bacterium]